MFCQFKIINSQICCKQHYPYLCSTSHKVNQSRVNNDVERGSACCCMIAKLEETLSFLFNRRHKKLMKCSILLSKDLSTHLTSFNFQEINKKEHSLCLSFAVMMYFGTSPTVFPSWATTLAWPMELWRQGLSSSSPWSSWSSSTVRSSTSSGATRSKVGESSVKEGWRLMMPMWLAKYIPKDVGWKCQGWQRKLKVN